jgi:hypothetical protein
MGAWVPPATAGTFTAWSCRTGSNEATEGLSDWFHSSYGVGNYYYGPGIPCQTRPESGTSDPFARGVLTDGANNPNLVIEDMSVQAPDGVTMTGARLWWKGRASPNGQVAAVAENADGGLVTLIDRRNGSFPVSGDPDTAPTPTDTLSLGTATGFTLRAACLGNCQTDPSFTIAEWQTYRVAFTLSDTTAPTGEAIGDLLTDPALRAQRAVTVNAADKGAGVYLARIVVDGHIRASSEFGDLPCRDADATNNDPFEFTQLRPCPASAATTVTLDSAQLAEDTYHHVAVEVLDAAGNTSVIARRTVGVDNDPPAAGFFDRAARRFQNPLFNIAAPRQLNGAGAGSGARLRVYLPARRTVYIKRGKHKSAQRRITTGKSKRTVSFHARPTLRAVLTDSSRHPITGATVWTAVRNSGSDWQITGQPHTTSRTGRIAFRLPAGAPSREVNLVYFPYSDSHEQAVGRPARLDVRCGVRLSVDRTTVRNGQRVRFRGAIEGGLPRRGVIASLQVKLGSRYRTFRQVRPRPGSNGAFRTAYRFTATTRPTRYRFRVLVPRQAGLPYARGTSPTRTVTVVP